MARELCVILQSMGKTANIKGFIIQREAHAKEIYGYPVYSEEILERIPRTSFLIGGMGSPKKNIWIGKLTADGRPFTTAIDPSCMLHKSVVIGNGSTLCQGVITTCDSTIGEHTIINIGVTINHDVHIGNFCHIAPGVHIAGNVHIGSNTWVGVGTTIIQNTSVGNNCFIGAGSVITKDIPDGYLSYGVPARPVRRLTAKDWVTLLK